MKPSFFKSIAILIVLFLFGCTSVTMIGERHTPISVDEVKLYEYNPDGELIAQLETSVTYTFSKSKAKKEAMDNLKNECAKLGANALVIFENQMDYAQMNDSYVSNGMGGTSKEFKLVGSAYFTK